MSVLRGVHERWACHGPLAARLPAERLFTGGAPGETELPYALLKREADAAVVYTSSGNRLCSAVLRLAIYDGDFDRASELAVEAEAFLRRAEFSYGEGRVLDSRLAARRDEASAEGVWRVTLEFLLTLDEHE